MDVKAFLDYLVVREVLTPEQIQAVLSFASVQKKPIAAAFIRLGYFSKDALKQLLEEFKCDLNGETYLYPAKPAISEESTSLQNLEAELLAEIEQMTKGDISSGTLKQLPAFDSDLSLPPQEDETSVLEEEQRYQVLETLGEGGMGVVQRVYDQVLQRELALKKLRAKGDPSDPALNTQQEVLLWRLRQEAAITAILEHPNIVPVYDMTRQNNGDIFFTMRKVSGETLSRLIKKIQEKQVHYEEEHLLPIFLKVCDAVSYAHSKGIIHRDLKPDNIMVGIYGEVYVMDWGIAKKMNSDDQPLLKMPSLFDSGTDFCRTIGGIGTPGYMAPEQARNANEVTLASDIYSLGKILRQCYIFLSPAEELQQKIHTVRRQRKLSKYHLEIKEEVLDENIPAEIGDIIQKATHPEPEARYPSVAEFVADLDQYQKNNRVSAREYTMQELLLKWMKRYRGVLTGAFLFVLSSFLLLFLLHWWKRKEQEERFQLAYQQMLHFQKQAQSEVLQEDRIQHSLTAFHFLNQALALQPNSELCYQAKLRLSERLMQWACEAKNYSLADYILHEIPESVERSRVIRNQLEAFLQREKKKALKTSEQRFQFWLKQLREGDWVDGIEEDALFEICQLPDEVVLEELISLVSEGSEYFLQSLLRSERTERFYTLMAIALGRRGNSKPLPLFRSSLQTLADRLFSMEKKPIRDLDFLIAVTNALGYLHDSESEEVLRTIRNKMGVNTLFWIRTETAYQKIVEHVLTQSDSTKNLYLKGTQELQSDNWNAAIQSFDQYLMQHPKEYAPYVHRGIAREKLKDWPGAIADYQKAIELNPNCIEAYINWGNIQGNLNHFSEAILLYNQAIQKDPNALSAYLNRGNIHIFLKEYPQAMDNFDTILKKDPQYVSAYLHRGGVKYHLEDYYGAIADYDRAIALNSGDPSYYNFRGLAQLKGNNEEAALSDFTMAIQISPQFSDAYANRGHALQEKGDLIGALRDFQQAIELDPEKRVRLFRRCADIYEALNELQKALHMYQQMLDIEPKNIVALQNRASLFQQMGDTKSSLQDLNQLLSIDPKHVEGYYNRGLLYYSTDEPKKAISDYQQALRLNPSLLLEIDIYGFSALAKKEISDRTGMLQDFTEALNRLELFLQKTPSQEAIEKMLTFLFPKVVSQANQGQYDEALQELLRFQPYLPQNHSKFSEYQEMIKQLKEAISEKRK